MVLTKAPCVVVVAFALCALHSAPVSAQWYVSRYGSAAIFPDTALTPDVAVKDPDVLHVRLKNLDLEAADVLGGHVGYEFPHIPGLGVAVEAYRLADEGSWDASSTGFLNRSARSTALGAPYQDFTTVGISARYRLRGLQTSEFPRGRLQPYAGVSVGSLWGNLYGPDRRGISDQGDARLGLQGLLGSSFALSRDTTLFAEYQFNQTERFDLGLHNSGVELGIRSADWTSFQLDVNSERLLGAFSFHF